MNAWAIACLLAVAAPGQDGMKSESFDRDPGWDGQNNRPQGPPVKVRQDFGYSPTGRAGGFVSAAAEPAYYGKTLQPRTLNDALSASGTLAVADGSTHLLVGFFNSGTVNEWRTPSTLALRVNGRGDHFFAYLEYCTSKWRAGGDSPQAFPKSPGFPSGGKALSWSLTYDPAGDGVITATLDGKTSVCKLDPGHKADGATFNRFGILNVMKSADGGTEAYLDDVTVNGERETFDKDPGWEGRDNRRTYETRNVRPWFDFGHSDTRFAGGKARGELGGLTFRGDCRYPGRMASYGDRVGPLTLEKPLRASGKIALRRGVTDSTTLFGFYHSADSMRVNPSQSDGLPESLAGFAIEGPSREGFCFYPVCRPKGAGGRAARPDDSPHLLPDGAPHDWTFEYDPKGKGRIVVTLDGRASSLDLQEKDKGRGTAFDRFGLVTTWIDGNGQHVYLDDLTYTSSQE